MAVKPTLSKGTRDYAPLEVVKRKYLFQLIEDIFQKYGFQPLETPAVENLSTLTGKYGNEGDKLLFHIRSNRSLKESNPQIAEALKDIQTGFIPDSSDRGLRYDLTVPMARFVAMNWEKLPMPFKRYQIQPVWRGDRPQRGRYQEFYQCDVDIVGSNSLFNEVELIQIYEEVFTRLGFQDFTIRFNNRKVLNELAKAWGFESVFSSVLISMDKIDKIGISGFASELQEMEDLSSTTALDLVNLLSADFSEQWNILDEVLGNSEGWKEVNYLLQNVGLSHAKFDISLARGLDYYTGTVFEVVTHEVQMGSLGGGGRYDNLTEVFGLKNMSGVGVSFGAERILDCMEELNLFPTELTPSKTKILFAAFDEETFEQCCVFLSTFRKMQVPSELYPEFGKLKKAMKYADSKQIPWVAILGDSELKENKISVKNMISGEQNIISWSELFQLS
jgi:histidyl-tRNA synthetase